MADIRINALATTATTPASDDYLALDGTAQGTRKILATNIANNVTDVILGTSGPSVKSSLSARAPRQGLVFDNTLKASITNGAILGTSDFTVAAWINRPASDLSVPLWGPSNSIGFAIRATQITVEKIGASLEAAWDYTVASSKFVSVIVKRSGTTYTCFVDGISIGDKTVGSVTNFSAAYSDVGFTNFTNGTIVGPYVYNRAISASEVVSLYEAGAPAGADYNSASNTAVYSTDFSSSTGWSLAGGTTISGGKLNLVDDQYAEAPSSTALVIGKNYRFTITVDSITAGAVYYFNGSSYVSFATSAGTYTVNFTAAASIGHFYLKSVSGNAVCDTFAIYNTGLLLAPDAAQAGGGLVWYDTSGNAANISWTSGVSWNVPFGNNIAASGTNQNITLTPSGTGVNTLNGGTTFATSKYLRFGTQFFALGESNTTYLFSGGAGGYLFRNGNDTATLASLTNTGNLLIGTTSDTGQKLQVSGTAAISVGNGSAATLQLNQTGVANAYITQKATTGDLALGNGSGDQLTIAKATGDATFAGNVTVGNSSADSGYTLRFTKAISGTFPRTDKIVFGSQELTNGSAAILGVQTAAAGAVGYLEFKTTTSGGVSTTALTLDATQKAIFAGKINAASLPTSASGLSAGDIWNDSGTLKIV